MKTGTAAFDAAAGGRLITISLVTIAVSVALGLLLGGCAAVWG